MPGTVRLHRVLKAPAERVYRAFTTPAAMAKTCLKPGFFPAQKYIEHSMSYAGMADFIGTLLIIAPVYALFTPVAYDLDETSVNIPMIPARAQTPGNPPKFDAPVGPQP